MAKCAFCGGKVPENKGKMFVKVTGQVFYFCNSKCQKNFRHKRPAKKLGWTETARALKENK